MSETVTCSCPTPTCRNGHALVPTSVAACLPRTKNGAPTRTACHNVVHIAATRLAPASWQYVSN